MSKYMTQSLSSDSLRTIVYYREQQREHVTHKESARFTSEAVVDYANCHHISEPDVDFGTFRCGQQLPDGLESKQI
ncbi:MAG: hypothetical protein AAF990_22190 [Bacteroidota bacterium]